MVDCKKWKPRRLIGLDPDSFDVYAGGPRRSNVLIVGQAGESEGFTLLRMEVCGKAVIGFVRNASDAKRASVLDVLPSPKLKGLEAFVLTQCQSRRPEGKGDIFAVIQAGKTNEAPAMKAWMAGHEPGLIREINPKHVTCLDDSSGI